MNLINEFNIIATSYISCDLWNTLQGYLALLVILGALLQRAWMDRFSSAKSSHVWLSVKTGQFGLYLIMMLGILALVDAYYAQEIHICHPFTAVWCLAFTFKQTLIFMHIFNDKVPLS